MYLGEHPEGHPVGTVFLMYLEEHSEGHPPPVPREEQKGRVEGKVEDASMAHCHHRERHAWSNRERACEEEDEDSEADS